MSQHPIEKLWREVGLPEYFLGNGGTNEKLYALYDAIRSVPQCARDREALAAIWELCDQAGHYSKAQFARQVAGIVEANTRAALSGKPGAAQDQLSQLRQAILDHTRGDGFWIGEILLAVLAKETGFNGAVTRPERSPTENKGDF